MDVEKGVPSFLKPLFTIFEAATVRVIRIALYPINLVLNLFKRFFIVTAPPVFHLLLLSSLVPFLGISSFGAGLVIRSWIPVGWKEVVYLQYGDDAAPYAEIRLPTLSKDQPYDVALEMVVPLDTRNFALGNFMSSITIITPSNVTIAHSRRPALILPPTFFTKSLTLTGALTTRKVHVPLLESFATTSYLSSLRALVQVGRKDGWKSIGNGAGQELVVLEVYAVGAPRLTGLRGFFARHSLILLFLTTIAFFFASSLATIVLYLYLSPTLTLRPPQPEDPTLQSIRLKAEEDEVAARRQLRSRTETSPSEVGTEGVGDDLVEVKRESEDYDDSLSGQ